MKNNSLKTFLDQKQESSSKFLIINIANSDILEIFGINNKNIPFFESVLTIKIFQRGNQLRIKGDKKDIDILRNAISATLYKIKIDKNLRGTNLIQETLMTQLSENPENVKNFTVIKTNKRDVVAKSSHQNQYLEILKKKQIVFATGPAGTGKTFLAVAVAVSQLLENKFNRIILSRPAVEAGEKLGFLPGDLKEKIDPYLRPLYDALYDLMPSDIATRKIQTAEIEIAPLAFMRGRTLNDSFVILDEAQNATHNQIKMFLTRCGKNSRMVVIGDPSQSDLLKQSDSGLVKSIKILEHIDNIALINFDSKDIVRDEMVTKIINAYDNHIKYFLDNSSQ